MASIGTQAIAELVLRIKAENLAGAALGSLAGSVRALPLIAAGAAAGMAVATTKMASDYQKMITQVANNTTMGTAGLHSMDAAIKSIAAHSPASLESLAQGYMHVTNFGFGAADATRILDTAQKSAVSTGGDVAQTANLLANVLHEYSLGGKDAAGAMDLLHLAAAQGNMTLEQLVESGGPAIAMAANLHVPLTQVAAAMAALTRHGATAGEASTYLRGILSHIVNPTKQARDELTALSAKTGIDLLFDFSPEGLETKGLTGVLADLRAAHIDAAQLFKAVPAIRGGIGAQILTGTGALDYSTILGTLDATMAGKTTPTADAYARSQQTLAFQTGVLKNNLQELGITIGTALLPGLTKLVAAVVPIVAHITAWASAHGKLIATATPIFIVLSTIAGLALVAGPAVAFLALAFSPLSLAVMAIVAAIGLLSVAWATNWGGIRQKAAAALSYIQPAITQITHALSTVGSAFKAGGLSAAASALMTQAGTLLGHLLSWITGTAWPAISTAVGRWATGFWGWVQRVTPPLLAALGALLGRLGAWIVGTALPAIGAQLGRWIAAFWQWVGPATASLISHLGPLLDRIGGWIGTTALPAISAKLVQWGTAFWQWIVVAMPLMEQKLGWFLGEMIVWIPTATVALALKLVEWGAAFIGWIVPRAAQMLANLLIFLGKIQTWIVTTAIPALLKLGWDMGTGLINGLIKGISDGAGQVKKAIENALHGRATPTAGGGASGFGLGPAAPGGHPVGPPGAGALLAGATAINPWAGAADQAAATAATASKDFAAALAAYRKQSGLDPADQKRMQADIALVAKSNEKQARHLQDLLNVATKHNHEAIRHQGAVAEMHRHQRHGGGGSGSGGGLSPATQNAINQLTGNAPKPHTPAQIATTDFATAMALFKAQKGLDPADIARMRADIATIARSDPGKAAHLQALLGIAVKHNHEAIAHAGAVAAHHARVEAHQHEQKAQHARQVAATDAVDHFKTDLLQLGTSVKDHGRLLWDVNRVKALEIAAHVRGAQVALDFAENMKKVRAHFHEAAAKAVEPYKQAGFALSGGAGYGQTTVTMGPVRDTLVAHLQAQLRELKAQNTRAEKQIALLEAELVEQHRAGGLLEGIFHNTEGTHQATQQTARHTQPRPTGGAHGFSQRTGMPVPV